MNFNPTNLPTKLQVLINNVDKEFFIKNKLATEEVIALLKTLPLPSFVRLIVLDGETSGEQKGDKSTRHPMLYAENAEGRKVAVFLSSKGHKTRNVGAKRVIDALRRDMISEVISI